MLIHVLRSKIHRVWVTAADLNYEGSITIDETLMDAAGILPFEKVQILNIANATRSETYVIKGVKDSGDICMNGAIARLAQIGDPLIILSYGIVKEDQAQFFKPVIVFVDDKNRITKIH
jgi:aspartate 1-decarboxylase